MEHTEIITNAQTGEVTIREMTQEEIAAVQAAQAVNAFVDRM